MDSGELRLERQGAIAILTLNRPHLMNAVAPAHLEEIAQIADELSEDDRVRVVLITGAGRGFCAGADLTQVDFAAARARHPARLLKFSGQWLNHVRTLSKPTIAAVNGVAVGAGLGFALACDIRVASTEARFSARFVRMGISVQDGVGYLLQQAVGHAKAAELVYTAEIIDAAEALRLGMVSYVVPPDDLMPRSLALAERIAANPPVALIASKYVLLNSQRKSYEDYLADQNLGAFLNAAYAQHDIVEGGKAFREKRTPQFRGLLDEAPGEDD